MNIDRIIKLAIEAKLLHESETKEYITECGVEVWISGQRGLDVLEKFAALVASAEREACAEICKKHADFYAGLEPSPIAQSAWAACVDNRDTIRARGQA